jgi:hypothetical protein
MASQDDARTLAGMVATANAVVAKQIPLRNPLPADLPRPLRPSTTADLPRLFRGNGDSPNQSVARLSSAALLYSVNKASTDKPSQLLVDKERLVLDDLHTARRDHLKDDRSCPHCRLLYDTLYNTSRYETGHYLERPTPPPPIAVVNHSARVNVKFDPETNISEARINNYQLIVPTFVAREMLRLSHPLRWAEPAGALFLQSDAVNAKGERLPGHADKVRDAWTKGEQKYIFENCVWPINADLNAASKNIIAFQNFFNDDDDSLSYTYRLQRSIQSNFGVAWERSGLDVDEGFYQARAVPIQDFGKRTTLEPKIDDDEAIPTAPLEAIPIGRLRRRDVLELQACHDHEVLSTLYGGFQHSPDPAVANPALYGPGARGMDAAVGTVQEPLDVIGKGEDATTREEIVDTVQDAGTRLASAWNMDFCVVNISASKRLHFTIPENSPIELWHLLTLTAPAFLFAFLNSAICLAPHVLIKTLINPLHEELAHGV